MYLKLVQPVTNVSEEGNVKINLGKMKEKKVKVKLLWKDNGKNKTTEDLQTIFS